MKTALLIIDVQNDYFEKGSMPLTGSDEAGRNAGFILEKCRKNNLTIVHIQHIAIRSGSTFFLPDTKGALINDYVKPLIQEKIIIKHYPNSFRETELIDYLKNKNITDLVICGMMTHMCVDATVRAAKDLGFNITLVGDACATRDLTINGQTVKAADVQNSFLAALSSTYATIKTTRQYLDGK
jgi:nicotinamidase-related amidase